MIDEPGSGSDADGPSDLDDAHESSDPPTSDPPTSDPRANDAGSNDPRAAGARRLPWHRSSSDKYVGGVLGGLAEWLQLDSSLVRVVAAAVFVLAPELSVAYLAAWVILPGPETGRSLLRSWRDEHSRRALIAIVGIAIAAALVVDDLSGSRAARAGIVLAIVGVVLLRRDRAAVSTPAGSAPLGQHAPASSTATAAVTATSAHSAVMTEPASPSSLVHIRRGRSFITPLTLSICALIVGVASAIDRFGPAVSIGGTVSLILVVISIGLMVSARYGRAPFLILIGLALVPVWIAFVPGHTHRYHGWGEKSVDVAALNSTPQRYTWGVGELDIDVSEAKYEPTARTTMFVGVSVGHAIVRVPDDVRLVLRGRIGLGNADVHIDRFGYNQGSSGDAWNHRLTGRFEPVDAACFREPPVPSVPQTIPTATAQPPLVSEEPVDPLLTPAQLRCQQGGYFVDRAAPAPELTIDADVGIGYLEVRRVPTNR